MKEFGTVFCVTGEGNVAFKINLSWEGGCVGVAITTLLIMGSVRDDRFDWCDQTEA